jgi:hypothetical protein
MVLYFIMAVVVKRAISLIDVLISRRLVEGNFGDAGRDGEKTLTIGSTTEGRRSGNEKNAINGQR